MIALVLVFLILVAVPLVLGTLGPVLIAFDQLVNAWFKGWPDETISSRAWRWEMNKKRTWPRKMIDTLFFFDPNHCQKSFESERLDRHLPPELRSRMPRRPRGQRP